jgi:inner membrane protein
VEGHSHVIVGVAGAVALDSMLHFSGPSLTGTATHVTTALLFEKALFYGGVAAGSLAPDMDNAHSTIGHRLGLVSRAAQRLAGHRTIFHSLLGLALWGLFGAWLQTLLANWLTQRGLPDVAQITADSHVLLAALLVGYFMHLFADSLTEGGVPWLWPYRRRFGFPPNPHWRFRSGSWLEPVVVWFLVGVVIAGIWTNVLMV